MQVAKGIITNGLGGDATNMILGQFHLGFVEVIIEEPDVDGGDYPQSTSYSQTPLRKTQDQVMVTFIIRHKKKTWQKSYLVDRERGNILIKVTKIINTTINKISVSITDIKKRLGNIKVNIWTR